MSAARQFVGLVRMNLLMNRGDVWFISMIQGVLTLGFILGFGYFIPDITEGQALYLTTGTATNTAVTVALVMLPQNLSIMKADGRLDYFLALPLNRDIYLFSQITFVAILALPGSLFAILFGAWHYDLSFTAQPAILAVVPLAILSLSGVGVAMAMLSPHQQLTNALTQLIIFYVLLFAPVLIPKEQLPGLLQHFAVIMPPAYVADAMRGALTDLPGTHLGRSLTVLASFSAVSLAISAATIRRRG